ncbi:MAG: hemerythrin family protein [Phaeospirillum sp.]|nr:hemerythrin family protein [Phaeospirillum sp.]
MMIEWTGRFDTGIAEVDRDHRRLVDLINQLDGIISDGGDLGRVGAVVDALVDYADYHFQREERILESVGYDGAGAHAEIHARFGHVLGDMVGVCMLHPDRENLLRLGDYLKSWLTDHILVEDMKFAALLRDRIPPHG